MKNKEKTFYLWVLGCQMNQSDGEKIAYLLKKAGFQAIRESEAALIIVLAWGLEVGDRTTILVV